MLTAVVGINWGDEGKGRMVDLLAKDQDIVVRYQGGNNAGHTVVNEKGKFVLNLLPSGILSENTINVMASGMVIDIEHLCGEIEKLSAAGVKITPENLKISDKATVCLPYHVLLDGLEEDRLAGKKFGSTRRGIAPCYGDKYLKKTIRMGDLFYPDYCFSRLKDIIEWKNMTVEKAYGAEKIELMEIMNHLAQYAPRLMPFICDTAIYLDEAAKARKNIMFEAQLGALRDIDYGIYPYTSSSSTIASYALTGSGVSHRGLDRIVGVMKAYSTCVGEGPFVVEMKGEEAEKLREAGGEYGAATGRPRRVGAFDIPASYYGIRMQGATEIALTKLDVLSYMDMIPICTAYSIDDFLTRDFPTGYELSIATPIYEFRRGWKCDISKCRSFEELPEQAQDYVIYLERQLLCPIKYISVGAGRDEYIEVPDGLIAQRIQDCIKAEREHHEKCKDEE